MGRSQVEEKAVYKQWWPTSPKILIKQINQWLYKNEATPLVMNSPVQLL